MEIVINAQHNNSVIVCNTPGLYFYIGFINQVTEEQIKKTSPPNKARRAADGLGAEASSGAVGAAGVEWDADHRNVEVGHLNEKKKFFHDGKKNCLVGWVFYFLFERRSQVSRDFGDPRK